jgi:uncharacterized protein YjbI with pentapeptide repeats
MPLVETYEPDQWWRDFIGQIVVTEGQAENAIALSIPITREDDNAGMGLVATSEALYVLRSKSSGWRYPWEYVICWWGPINAVEIVTREQPKTQAVVGIDPDATHHFFQTRGIYLEEFKEFARFVNEKLDRQTVYKTSIDLGHGLSGNFKWRAFAGYINFIPATDVDTSHLPKEAHPKLNEAIEKRTAELKPLLDEIQLSHPFTKQRPSSWGKPTSEIDREQLRPKAILKNADLSGSMIGEVNLLSADLSGANLSGANLQYAYLSHANLSGANLTKADLRGAVLYKCNLENADLRGANLSWSTLGSANLKFADLSGSDLRNALLSDACLESAVLVNAILGRVELTPFDKKRRRQTNYGLAAVDQLPGTYLAGANLSRANLLNAKIDFKHVVLENLEGGELKVAVFTDAIMPDGTKHL